MSLSLFVTLFFPVFGFLTMIIGSISKPKNLLEVLSILVFAAIIGLIFTGIGYSFMMPALIKLRTAKKLALLLINRQYI